MAEPSLLNVDSCRARGRACAHNVDSQKASIESRLEEMLALPDRREVNQHGASFALGWRVFVSIAASWLCTQKDAIIWGQDGVQIGTEWARTGGR
ncbi:uncharacterized protein LAESUDRAFT_762225 [Laetiporus sulphureus 93-53]|uniref:Uncharacterized protein n=1 Tax=Laetiporus sulphureus 93-53 TaxID=1314785 RepID=A0A165CL37_9APHY|nr:uncharacterized protein LAESUDRAFT_762225 [Laetiporus sulphureus 93-53]KZT03003.1 hypothetical protein LAESUDRAFT_762225 [Laetiporus sulphureus 93-53]